MVQTSSPSKSEGQFLIIPVSILQMQMVRKGNVAAVKVLIQWSNLPPEDATWEDMTLPKLSFLLLVLEDKDVIKAMGMS